MARERLTMRKTKEILRLHLACGLSRRQIANSINIGRKTVADYLGRAKAAGLMTWSAVETMTEEELETRLFVDNSTSACSLKRPLPDCVKLHEEMRNPHVTLALLWQEYKQQHPNGYQYGMFVLHYNAYKKKLNLVMRQEHKAGEKVFLDYCDGLNIADPQTGEILTTELFVAVWGASNYTYSEASRSQDLASWAMSHARALQYFGCVPAVLVPENLKSGVTKACRYEPDLNPAYHDLARHYGAAVIPARPRHPRDKAKVEAGVLVAQRWILAALRHRTFFSLAEMNLAIRELLEKLNTKLLKKIKKSRRQLFEEVDRPVAKPLPERSYEYAEWKKPRVNIDYHIEVDHHYYSTPFRLVGQTVDVRLTQTTVEILHKGVRVRSHARSFEKYKPTTHPEDMPLEHRRYSEWTPSRIIEWAGKIGPSAAELVQKIIESKDHPEQGYRAALGIIRLERSFGKARIEAACHRALAFKIHAYKSVKRILKCGADRSPWDGAQALRQPQLPFHGNIRGSAYYHEEGNA